MPIAVDRQEILSNSGFIDLNITIFICIPPTVVLTRAVLAQWLPDLTQEKQDEAIFAVCITKTANVTCVIFLHFFANQV